MKFFFTHFLGIRNVYVIQQQGANLAKMAVLDTQKYINHEKLLNTIFHIQCTQNG